MIRERTPGHVARLQAVAALPGYAALRVVQEQRVLDLDDRQAAALTFSSVLSLPEVLDALPPRIAERLT